MLIFVIPLRHPETANDWSMVSRLANHTLRSVCAQTCDEFRVIFVCNEPPLEMFSHPAIEVLTVDVPSPGDVPEARMRDKYVKIKRGLVAARAHAPAHIMRMDADDCVHRGLAALVRDNPVCDGWIFDRGYMHDRGSRWLYVREEFHLTCGSSAILRATPEELPESPDQPDELFPLLHFDHTHVRDGMAGIGRPLRPMPFIGAIYMTDTGENHTSVALRNWRGKKMLLRKLLNSRPLTRAIRERYGIVDP